MTGPAYPAARAAALRVERSFAQQIEAAPQHTMDELAVPPDSVAVEAIIDAAFWASLRREEGFTPKISLALIPPQDAGQPLLFERALPLLPEALTRLAPAVERPGIHLGVWPRNGSLCVWGTTRIIPTFCFVLEVIAPGLLVVKHRRNEDSGKFVNMAVLEGDRIKMLDHTAGALSDCPELVSSLLGFDTYGVASGPVHVLIELAVSMRAHGRGGALLVVPSNSDSWQSSVMQPIAYSVLPSYSELGDLLQARSEEPQSEPWREAFHRCVEAVAGLTAVDGATVMNDEYQVLAFGAKIGRRDGCGRVEQVIVTEPVEGTAAVIMNPAQLGGTRHISAAQFAQDQQGSVALVASQDGRFTVFSWSACESIVHAYRIETLLL